MKLLSKYLTKMPSLLHTFKEMKQRSNSQIKLHLNKSVTAGTKTAFRMKPDSF